MWNFYKILVKLPVTFFTQSYFFNYKSLVSVIETISVHQLKYLRKEALINIDNSTKSTKSSNKH